MREGLLVMFFIGYVSSISPGASTCREVKQAYRETRCCHPDVSKNTSVNGLCAYGTKTQSGMKISFSLLRNENVTMSEFHQMVEPFTASGKSMEFFLANEGSQLVGCEGLCEEHWTDSYFRSVPEALAYFTEWTAPEAESNWKAIAHVAHTLEVVITGPGDDMDEIMDFFEEKKISWDRWANELNVPPAVYKYREFIDRHWDKRCA